VVLHLCLPSMPSWCRQGQLYGGKNVLVYIKEMNAIMCICINICICVNQLCMLASRTYVIIYIYMYVCTYVCRGQRWYNG
jgi:hypothetical protein